MTLITSQVTRIDEKEADPKIDHLLFNLSRPLAPKLSKFILAVEGYNFPSLSKAFSQIGSVPFRLPSLKHLELFGSGLQIHPVNVTFLESTMPCLAKLDVSGTWFRVADKEAREIGTSGTVEPLIEIGDVDSAVQLVSRLPLLEELTLSVTGIIGNEKEGIRRIKLFLDCLGSLTIGEHLKRITILGPFFFNFRLEAQTEGDDGHPISLRAILDSFFQTRKFLTALLDWEFGPERIEFALVPPMKIIALSDGSYEFFNNKGAKVSRFEEMEGGNSGHGEQQGGVTDPDVLHLMAIAGVGGGGVWDASWGAEPEIDQIMQSLGLLP